MPTACGASTSAFTSLKDCPMTYEMIVSTSVMNDVDVNDENKKLREESNMSIKKINDKARNTKDQENLGK